MKITIKHAFGIAVVNENFELEGIPTIGIAQTLNDAIDSDEKGFLMLNVFEELKRDNELIVEPDDELKELILQAENTEDDEIVY